MFLEWMRKIFQAIWRAILAYRRRYRHMQEVQEGLLDDRLEARLAARQQPGLYTLLAGYKSSIAQRDWEDSVVDKAIEYRRRTMRGMVAFGKRAIEPLSVELLQNQDWGVREDMAMLLGFIGHPKAIPALLQALERDESLAVQRACAVALERIGSPKSTQSIKQWRSAHPHSREWWLQGYWAEISWYGDTHPKVMQEIQGIAAERSCTFQDIVRAYDAYTILRDAGAEGYPYSPPPGAPAPLSEEQVERLLVAASLPIR